MPHHVYTTPGFIVHSLPSGEAGKYLLVFTRDLGMIGCTAQGVRLSQSKLRYYTQDYFFGLFSVVRGKDVWRMIGAKEVDGAGEIQNDENKKVWVQILALLRRLLPGEEKNERVFQILEEFYLFLSKRELDKEDKELIEYVTVLRILHSLGYIKNTFENLLESCDLNEGLFGEVLLAKDQIVKAINDGLKESQL